MLCRCIPYRLKSSIKSSIKNIEEELEVLVISAQRKGKGVLFPKVNSSLLYLIKCCVTDFFYVFLAVKTSF